MTNLDPNLKNEKSSQKRDPFKLFKNMLTMKKSSYIDRRIKTLEKKIENNEDIGIKLSNEIGDLIYKYQILNDFVSMAEETKDKRRAEKEIEEIRMYIEDKYIYLEIRHRTLIKLKNKLEKLKSQINK